MSWKTMRSPPSAETESRVSGGQQVASFEYNKERTPTRIERGAQRPLASILKIRSELCAPLDVGKIRNISKMYSAPSFEVYLYVPTILLAFSGTTPGSPTFTVPVLDEPQPSKPPRKHILQ